MPLRTKSIVKADKTPVPPSRKRTAKRTPTASYVGRSVSPDHRAGAASNLAVQKRLRAKVTPASPDAIAASISSAPTLLVQRACHCGGSCSACQEEDAGLIQRMPHDGTARSGPVPNLGRLGSGRPLARSARAFMEPRFGRDLSSVRLHTDGAAAQAADALHARAFTVGQHVYFGAGQYRPERRDGRRLLAHELTHTVQQQSAPPRPQARLALGKPGDHLEREADRVASHVVDGYAAGTITAVGTGTVQRDLLPDLPPLPELPSWEEVEERAENAFNAAVETGEELLEEGEELLEEGQELVGQAAEWIASEAGQAALEAANAVVSLFGGSIVIRKGCIVITIPSVPLFPTIHKTFGPVPLGGIFVPLLEGGAMVGPVAIAGAVGLLGYAQGSGELAAGPGEVRNIRFELCPFTGTATATAQLYAAVAVAPRISLFGGVAAGAGALLPTAPPLPIIATVHGGLRGTGTGWLVGAAQDTVTVTYSSGTLSLANVTKFMGGVLLQGDLDLYGALNLYDKQICEYSYRLGHWETGRAWQVTIPIHGSIGSGGSSGSIGPITWGPMPIGDIQTVIQPLPTGWNCLDWGAIKRFLCDRGVLPEDWCQEDGEGEILKKERALAICKCVGDNECGGGKMYKKCFYVSKNVCNDKGKLQKEGDSRCNNTKEMKEKCTRPKCYYRHTDVKCPVKESECRDGYFGSGDGGGTPAAASCPVPVNLRQTAANEAGDGELHFEYAFDSSTGDLRDLHACQVGEYVTYPGGSPYVWPSPPWDGGSTQNPTEIWIRDATRGTFEDNHRTHGFKKPYRRASFIATQVYRYRTACKNGGRPVVMSRKIRIARAVTQNRDGSWKYRITKSGAAAEVDPLP